MHTQNRNGSNYFFVGKWEILPLSVTRHFEKRSHFKLKSQEKKSFITQIYVSLRQLKSSFPTVAICGSRERKKRKEFYVQDFIIYRRSQKQIKQKLVIIKARIF